MKPKRDYNYVFTFNNPPITSDEFNEIIKKHIPDPIVYCIFRKEIGKNGTPHFQGYLELSRNQSYTALHRLLFKDNFKKGNGSKSWIHWEYRLGTQSQAIDYFLEENKDSYLPEEKTLESGEKKIDYDTNNRKNNNRIPWSEEKQLVYIWEEMVSGRYKTIADVRKDFKYLVIAHKSMIKQMLYDSVKVDSILIDQALVICISAESGNGKSTLSKLITKQLGYDGTQVYPFSASLVKSSSSPFFNSLEDYHEVCFVEEMDEKTLTSHYQFWVSLIDRNKPLNTKGGYMRNPFKVIIINSVKPLYELLAKSWKDDNIDSIAKQILRRCCDPISGSYFIDIPSHIGNKKRIAEKKKILDKSFINAETTYKDPYKRAEWYFKDVVYDEIKNSESIWDHYQFSKESEKSLDDEKNDY